MKKLFSGVVFVLVMCSFSLAFPKKNFIFKVQENESSGTSIKLWKIKDFPFLGGVHIIGENFNPSGFAPSIMRWPAAAVQNFGSANCGSVSFNVSVEVFLAGITDANPTAAGPGMACVAHIGKVSAFGSGCATPPWECIQNFPMTYSGSDTGDGFDVFSTTITNLQPGLYEVTCACADNGPFVDPYSNPEVRWIGTDCPGVNTFTNGHFTVNATAPNDDCGGSLVSLNNGSNTVNNNCSIDGMVGFSYTVINGGSVNFTASAGTVINPLINPIRLNNPCAGPAVATLPITCLAPGTVVYLQAGNDNACPQYGNFNITVSDLPTVPHDQCVNANVPTNFGGDNQLTCGESDSFTGNPIACPDAEANVCFGATTAGIWYTFTTSPALSSFSITPMGSYELFTGSCGALTSLGCTNINEPNTPGGGTYYLLVGPTGTVTVQAASVPSNDICSNALPVSIGTTPNLSNVCATTDFISCGSQSEASVWYSYMVGSDIREVVISADLPGSMVRVFSQCNLANLTPDSDGVNCNNSHTLSCPAPGTYYIQVGSSFASTGIFSLTISQTTGISNDVCSNSTPVSITNDCAFHPVNISTSNACPETFNFACNGGNYNADPTVWMSFTPPAGVTSINIRNITPATAYLSIFPSCGAGATIAGGGCLTGGPSTPDINVTAGTTYYIAVATVGTGSSVDFELKYNTPPANDVCTAPVPVNVGPNPGLTNVCATQDQTPCPATANESSVWYSYNIPAGVKTLTITSSLANSVVNVYESTANCSSMTYVDVVNCDNEVILDCPGPQTILIMVSSSEANEGIFTLTLDRQDVTASNDLCTNAQTIPQTPTCQFFPVTATTTVGACPENFTIPGCALDYSTNPIVWYSFTAPAGATSVEIENISANAFLTVLNGCPPPAPGIITGGNCLSGSGTNGTPINVTAGTTYYIAIGINGTPGNVGFNIKYNVPPANDVCTSPIAVNAGANAGLTNVCATLDQTPCPAPANQSSVWYSYTIPPGVQRLTITSSLTGGVVNVYENTANCNSMTYVDAVNCDNEVILDCPEPQTILIMVSSSQANAGIFTLTLNRQDVTAANDLCANAQTIPQTPTCVFFPVTATTTVGACPENFTIPGCALDYSTNPIIWYSFTAPPGATSVEIENISANAFLTILNGCPPPAPGIIAGGNCLSGNGTNGTPINVTAGTTYYIAIGINGAPGNVGFNIKYNIQQPNDNPCQGGFVPTVLTNGSPLSMQNNVCATQDNNCGAAPVSNSLWYSFTLAAGFDQVSITVTGLTSPSIGIYSQANPCNQTAVNEECNGDGIVEFNCLQPGTYMIMVGTSAANAGDFTITATQGTNAGVPNDLCQNATVLPGQPYDLCTYIGPFPSTNIDACPELGLTSFGNCNFMTEETSWYSFVAPGVAGQMPSMDFRFISYTGTGTPFMGLFTGSCGALTNVTNSCLSGVNTVFSNIGPLTPGQTYYIALASFGDTGGNFNFEIRFNVGPPNDDECHTAPGFDLGSGGSILATNLCSGTDFTIPDCPATSSQNSVWFTFTVNPGSYGINIRIDADENSPTPLIGPIAAGAFTTACTNPILNATTCLNNRQDGVLDCLEPGTYNLQISTSSLEAGDFTITTSQLVDNRSCPSGPLADNCIDAIQINLGGIVCTPVPVSGCNINACPEGFTSGGCQFNQNPTVWYRFTVDGGAASIDITQMTAGYNYAILTGNPCTDNPVTGLAGYLCLNAANTLNIPVTGGQSYYLIVSNQNGGQFSFNIIQNVFPENDDPNTSSPRPPYVLSVGGSHQGTTCCALGYNDGPTLDTQNLACSSATHDGAVWYTYTTGNENGVTITVTPSGPAPISGPTTVEVLTGNANSPGNTLFNNTSFSCGALPAQIKIGCYDPGEIMWIKVASQNQFCGTFSIMIEELNQCPLSETCADATNITTIGPIDPSCSTVSNVSIPGCLEAACPETTIANCGMDQLPTVWFQIQTTSNQGLLSTTVSTGGSWQPIWSVYYGGCAGLTPIATIVPPPGTGVLCSIDNPNPNVHAVPVINGENNYWIAVSGQGVIDDPNFVLSISQLAGCISCIGSAGCAPSASWTVTQRSSTRPLNDPFFCQGEDVRFCVNFTYDPTGSVAEWIHAIIPDFGPGWDLDVFNPSSITLSPGNPTWQSEDAGFCAPRISETMPFLCTYIDPVTGKIKLCNAQCQSCPCSPPLMAGSALPSGWYWISNGGSGCINDCRPQTHWGLPGSSSPTNINFCLNMKVRTFDTEAECNQNRSLRFSFQTTSDGVSGCWQDAFECKFDYAQIGPNWQIDCDRPPQIISQDRELCVGGLTNIQLSNDEGASNVVIIVTPIPNPNVTGANNHTFTGGSGVINDNLQNSTSAIQIQQYEAYAQVPGFICPSPLDTITVTLYPQLLVNFPEYALCPENEFGQNVVPNVSGGSGVYTGTSVPFVPGYQWSHGPTTQSISVMPTSTTSYTVTVTDDKGCSNVGTAIVQVLNPVTFDLTPPLISLCGVSGSETVTLSNVVTNGGVNFNWNIPFGLNAVASGNNLTINAAGSLPSFNPYDVSVTVIDNRGCLLTKSMQVRIGEAASGQLIFTPPVCGGPLTADIGIGSFSSPGNFSNKFTLLDCNGDEVFGNGAFYVIYSDSDQFNNVDLTSNNCFRILIESIDVFTGESLCAVVTDPVTIPIPTGVPASLTPDRVICAGESTTIAVTNAANYTMFSWSPPQGNVSNFSVSPTTTTQYTVTATQSNGCTSVRSVTVTVNPNPTPGVTGSLSFCPGENTQLTASGGTSYVWSGPSGFMSSNAATGPITLAGDYSVTVTNANGCSAITTRSVIEDNELSVSVPDLYICDEQPGILDAGDGFTSYEWLNPANVVISTDQTVSVTMAGAYTLSVTDGLCAGSTVVTVINNNTPILNIRDTVQVCRLVNGTNEFPTFVNFEAESGGASGTWFNTDTAPVDVSDWSNVSFTTVPQRDTFNFTFVTNSAVSPCQDISRVLTVVVRNCVCPSPTITLPNLCNSRTTPFLLNNNWVGTPPPGVWTVENGPAPLPVIVNNNEVSVNGIQEGTYRFRYTYTPAPGGACNTFLERDLLVFGAPNVTAQNAVLCNNTTGTDPTTLNLNSLITALTEPSAGMWTQVSGDVPTGSLPDISVLGMNPQILVFEYTTTAVPPCTPEKVQVEVRIRNCDCVDVTILGDTLCNGSMTLLDLQLPGKFSINPTTATGTWSIAPPNSIAGGQFFNPFGVSAGNYTATFTLDGNIPPGCQSTFTKSILIRNQPSATFRTDTTACSVSTGNGPTSINLFTLINPGYTTGGSWTQVSPAMPVLNIPGNGIVDFAGQNIGTEFVFRYSVNAQAPCNPIQVDAKVTIRDCNCPDVTTVAPPALCNDSGTLDLSTLVGANTAAGVWTVTGPEGPVGLSMGTILNGTGLVEGNYTLTYTLTPAPGGTCPRFSTQILRINDLKTAVVAMDTFVCNITSPLGSSILNLNDLVRSGDYGVWKDQNGDLILTPTAVNFTGQAIGTVLIYTYEVENNDPCVDQTYPVEITVIDCACEQVVLGVIPAICADQGSIDLTAYSDPKPGNWTADNPALVITNGILTLTGVPTGVYQLTYTLTNPEPGCPTSRSTTISIFAPRNAGTPTTAQFCADASETVVLANLLSGEDTGGTWTSTGGSVGAEFSAANGTFNITGKTPGTYTFRYAFTGQQPCPDVNATVTVIINPLPIADVGANPRNINCTVQTTVLGGPNTSSGPTISYNWMLNGETVATTRDYTVSRGGIYTLTVLNTETGCSDTKTVQVIQADDLPIFDVAIDSIRCFGQRATISISNVRGGLPPYQVSFNNGTNWGTNFVAANLAQGTYRVLVRDANGCINDQLPAIVIVEPPLLTVSLGDDITLNLNEDTLLTLAGSFVPANIRSIIWKRGESEITEAANQFSYLAMPSEDTDYSVIMTDLNGCVASDVVRISIRRLNPECIPNIFTPNDRPDSNNDYFSINCSEVDEVLKYRIYDRWGNLIFISDNIQNTGNTIDQTRFWDGRFKGSFVVPGVYVYYIELKFKNGEVEKRAGDVTVLR